MKTKTLRLVPATFAIAAWGAAASAELVLNGDFENPDYSGSHQNQSGNIGIDFLNWEETGPNNNFSADEGAAPGGLTNQTPRYGNGGSVLHQDLAHNWSSSDTYTLSFNATETSWRTGTPDTMTATLRQTDGTVLWTSGTINVDTYAGGGATPWAANQTFSYTIEASAFTAGSEGEQLRVQFARGGVFWLDNVSLVVPEPGSLALLGLGGLLVARRRR